jgi:hypothetical protein
MYNFLIAGSQNSRSSITSVLRMLLMGLLAAPWSLAIRAQSSCKTVLDADDKKDATPYHAYVTRTTQMPGAKSESNEAIFVGGVSYIQIKGVWKKSPYTAEQQHQKKLENRKNAKEISCKYLRDEPVSGELAHVYAAHTENEDVKSDATIWVSAVRGLILRNEQDLDVGGAGGKSHMSIRYDYAHVNPPPGVR